MICLQKQAINLYVLTDKAYDYACEAEQHFNKAMKMIKEGGLDKEHAGYQSTKEMHIKVLKKLQDKEKLEQAQDFYRVCSC